MCKRFSLLFILLAITTLSFSQEIQGKWDLNTGNGDFIELNDGNYNIKISDPKLIRKGDYLVEDSSLFLFGKSGNLSTHRYKILKYSESTLTLEKNGKKTSFKKDTSKAPIFTDQVKPSKGISFGGLLRGLLGMLILLAIAILFSKNRKAINWKTVGLGVAAQLILAVGVLKVGFIQSGFEYVGGLFVLVLDFTRSGSEFLLGGMMSIDSYGFIFLFQVLPTIIFFSALTSVLFYLGIIQKIVKLLAIALTKLLAISGAESLSVAGNIFLGQTEAPLMIKAYLEKMNKSEILLVMIGGMATVAGGVLAAYIGFLGGDDHALRLEFAKHLLAASVMAAPGAIVIAKILYPQTEPINTEVEVSKEKIGSNILDAISTGTTEGLKLAANVGAMLLVFIAFIAMINYSLGWVGDWSGLNGVIAENTPYSAFSL